MRRLLPALLVVAGCDHLFGVTAPSFDAPDGGPRDGSVDACSAATFANGTTLTEIGTAYDPQLRGDLRELFFVRSVAGYDLFHATRPSVGDPFGGIEPLTALNTAGNDADPTITADGLNLLFKRDDGTGEHVYEATRTSVSSAFVAALPVPGLPAVNSLDISPDGLTLYFEIGGVVSSSERPSRLAPFGPPKPVSGGGSFLSISGDQREVFFNKNGVTRQRRTTLADGFGAEQGIEAAGSDPDISADGSTLVMLVGSELQLRHRTCVP